MLWGALILGVLLWLGEGLAWRQTPEPVGVFETSPLETAAPEVSRDNRTPIWIAIAMVVVASAIFGVAWRSGSLAASYWGGGFVVGALGPLVAWRERPMAALGPVLVVAALALIFGGNARVDTLLGAGAGWVLASWAMNGWGGAPSLSSVSATGLMVLTCGAAAMGAYREAISQSGPDWSSLALVLAAIQVLTVRMGEKFAAPRGKIASGILGGLAGGVACGLVAPNAPGVWSVGWLGGMVAAWLVWATPHNDDQNDQTPALAILLVAAGALAGHLLLQGTGSALLLLAAWAPLALAASGAEKTRPALARQIASLWMLGALIVLYRVFEWRYRATLTGVSFNDFYTLLALLAGLALPLQAARGGILGPIFAAALLAGAALVGGARVGAGLFFGLAAGVGIGTKNSSRRWATPLFLALWCALLMCQGAAWIWPLAQRPRAVRLEWLAQVALGLALVVVARALANWWRARSSATSK